MNGTYHYAFRQDNPRLVNCLITEVEVYPVPVNAGAVPVKAMALWDTGAMSSVITNELSKTMGLIPVNRRKVAGVNNISIVDVARISVRLPNNAMIKPINVSICKLTGNIGMLIGMDIIKFCDFAISSAGGKTLFTFAMPPFEDKTDLYEKAVLVNGRNK